MNEKILKHKQNGMLVLLLTTLVCIAGIVGLIYGIVQMENGGAMSWLALVIPCAIIVCLGWIPYCGLKVLKPQEALVLTLFGKYIGTLKGEGFYAVNPFCSGVNPAAGTKLNQSGDVDSGKKAGAVAAQSLANASIELATKKISRRQDRQ